MDTSVTAQQTVSQTIESINEIRITIHQAEKKIKRLGERSQEIGGIVGLINNIAERTHLLSLNASMHAAAAGEAGKSLMVVVDEVQRLAENSREATAEISSLVNNIQLETADTINVINTVISNVVAGTKLAEQAGERMQETLESTEILVDSVDKISHDVLEQEKVAERLLNRATTLDESSKLTHRQLEQQTELSQALVTAAEELQTAVNVFKLAAV
jgi:twitching motility protein PilJ